MTRAPHLLAEAPRTRVAIVDDSAAARGLLARWLAECDDLELVGAAANGLEAVSLIPAIKPDVVILDIEMPQMNGLEALPLIRIGAPNAAVIMSSRLTRANAELALRCLEAGAAEVLPKPTSDDGPAALRVFQRELLHKVRALGGEGSSFRPASLEGPGGHAIIRTSAKPVAKSPPSKHPVAPRPPPPAAPRLMQFSEAPRLAHTFDAPRVILIGSSTGGPNACSELIGALKPAVARVPVVIAQHMPPVFTRVFAEHLERSTGVPCREARDGETLRAGHVAIAPGGHHVTLFGSPDEPRLQIDDRPPIRFSRPSVDLLFESARAVFDGQVAAVVLTGMGSDGLEGARALAAAGAAILVQDEASSVVWGMPGAIARAGVAHDILPPAGIAAALCAMTLGARSS